MKLSAMTPTIPRSPAAICAATSLATAGWRRWSRSLLPCERSMTRCAGSDEVACVLRRDRVDEFARRRESDLDEVEEQAPRHAETVVDPERAVAVRVGYQSLPANARSRLHEIRAHDHYHVVPQFLSEVVES